MKQVAGFYGKLPSHGDFLSRRLPRQFIEPWDRWLQGGLAASREQLGKDWLKTFLVSPIWEFALAPGLCGQEAWAGVMMPSVDKVGRYFPLTLAAKVEQGRLSHLFDPACAWFEKLSQLALSTLEYNFDLQDFDTRLERLGLAEFLAREDKLDTFGPGVSGRLAFRFLLDSKQETPRAFIEMGNALCERFLAGGSYWRSVASEDTKPVMLFCEGLPPSDAFVGFLNGAWPRRGWNLYAGRLQSENANLASLDTKETQAVDSDVDTKSLATPNSVSASNSEDDRPPSSTEPCIHAGNPQNGIADDAEKTLKKSESKPIVWESCAVSVVGMRRQLNEDAVLDRGDAGLWAVADGMGGHSAGDVASQALIDALAKIAPVDDLEHYSEQVASCLHQVNRDLVQMGENRGFGQIVGSTIVVMLTAGREFCYLWAGDSRLYLFRQGRLEQLTTDHSLYNESLSLGLEPLDGSLEQGRGNVITRAIGADRHLQLDLGQGHVEAKDIFILCSDGIDKELSHNDIADICGIGAVEEIAHSLVEQAEFRGGRDNISVIVIKASEAG